MQWYESEVQQLQSRVAALDGNPFPSAFYGSSTIRLWEHIAQDLGDPSVLNLGFGGSTLEACVYFFDRIFSPLTPRAITVYAGDNDLGDAKSPDQVLVSFRALAAKVEAHFPAIPFTFISIKPSPARLVLLDRIRATNTAIQEDIAMRARGYFISVFEAMLTPGGKPRSDLFEADGLHMNQQGYQLWTRLLEPYKEQIVPDLLPHSGAPHPVDKAVTLTR